MSNSGAHEPNFRLECLTSLEQMQSVKDGWVSLENELADGKAIFQTYQWCKIWADHFIAQDKGYELALFVGRDDQEITFVCPLVVKRKGPLRIGYWMADPLTQYGSALVRQDAHSEMRIMRFWSELKRAEHMDAVWFKYIRHDSNLAPYLAQHGNLLNCEQAVSLNLKDFASWDDLDQWFNGRHSRSSRRGRKQARRRLFGLGEVEFRRLQGPDILQQALAETLDFKAYWLEKGGLRSSTFANRDIIDVLKRMVCNQDPNSECRVYAASVDGKAVAYDIGFTSYGRFVSHIGAFHPDYGQASPGNYLMEEIMADLANEGFEWFDLMAPAYDYKVKWSSDLDDVCDYVLALNWRGCLFGKGYLARLRPFIKTMLDKMPLGMRRVVKLLQDRLS